VGGAGMRRGRRSHIRLSSRPERQPDSRFWLCTREADGLAPTLEAHVRPLCWLRDLAREAWSIAHTPGKSAQRARWRTHKYRQAVVPVRHGLT
jgi:hypothetical protein